MRRFAVGIIAFIIITYAVAALAQPTPKPSPSPSATLCMNKLTGAIRDILSNNSVGCHKTEIEVSLDTLLALQPAPTAAPSAVPSADPSATSTPVPDPSETPTPGPETGPSNAILDSTGKTVGIYVGPGLATSELARTTINGVPVSLPVTQAGFVDQATTGGYGFLTVVYTSSDCSGAPNIILGSGSDPLTNQPLDFSPLVQTTTDGGSLGTYIFQNIAYFANQENGRYSLIQFNSTESFVNPEGTPVSGCQSGFKTQQGMGGPLTSFDLSGLGLTPPFRMAQ